MTLSSDMDSISAANIDCRYRRNHSCSYIVNDCTSYLKNSLGFKGMAANSLGSRLINLAVAIKIPSELDNSTV
jgi:hypothetical protein